jgi:DNA transformation protein
MAVSDPFLAFVVEQLDGVPHIVTKRMFGGVGVYSDGTFFAVIDNDTLFFKVDETLAVRYRERGMPPFAPIPGAKPMMGYYQVPVDVLEDAVTAATWARDSIHSSRDQETKSPKVSRAKEPKGPKVQRSGARRVTSRRERS